MPTQGEPPTAEDYADILAANKKIAEALHLARMEIAKLRQVIAAMEGNVHICDKCMAEEGEWTLVDEGWIT